MGFRDEVVSEVWKEVYEHQGRGNSQEGWRQGVFCRELRTALQNLSPKQVRPSGVSYNRQARPGNCNLTLYQFVPLFSSAGNFDEMKTKLGLDGAVDFSKVTAEDDLIEFLDHLAW